MLTKAKIAFLQSLAIKKHRKAAGLFLAEGPKIVGELLASSFEVVELFRSGDWQGPADIAMLDVSPADLARISALTTPNQVAALVKIPDISFDAASLRGKLVLGLENIQDPGNLGAIMRLADWFGIDTLLASATSADCFNPKVVQATMGSIARVQIHYCDDLPATVRQLQGLGKRAYAAALDGEDLYRSELVSDAVILFGNESQGLSPAAAQACAHALRIPTFNASARKAESLNVAMAASIVCSEFRRQGR
jgi:TrmH family RNA methyltransferase